MAISDFIFGTLATDEQRHARALGLRQGVTHNHRRSPRDPQRGQAIVVEMTAGPKFCGDRAWVYWTSDGSDPVGRRGRSENGHAAAMEFVTSEWDTELWGYSRLFRAAIPGQSAGRVIRYRMSLEAEEQGEVFADHGAYYAVYVDNDPTPAWTRDAVIYQVFVDRFFPGSGKDWLKPERPDGFFGGTIRGITEKLDYISDLGCNCLWLTPIFPSPSHHGYDATDLFEVEPRLGSKLDLQMLIAEAHKKDIRVLLDFVPNHISDQHPAFQEAIHNPRSPYCSWFNFEDYPESYASFFGVKSLPQVNLRHPAARQYVLEAARHWLELGVDGYRVDYAVGPTPDFWADFRRVTRAVRPDCWTFGEVVDPPDVQLSFEGTLDGCLDFVLLEAIRKTLAFGEWTAYQLGGFLDSHEAFYPPLFSRPSFLDNHDMNRFLWAANGDKRRLKLAALLQFTLSGAPVIYYGTEVGLSQRQDVRQGERGVPEESRLPMLWGREQDKKLLAFYKKLILMRRLYPCLRVGQRINVVMTSQTLVYLRTYHQEQVLVALNAGTRPRKITLPYPKTKILVSTEEQFPSEEHADTTVITLPSLSGLAVKIDG